MAWALNSTFTIAETAGHGPIGSSDVSIKVIAPVKSCGGE